MFLIKKILVFLLMFAILIAVKEGFLFTTSFIKNEKFEISRGRMITLGVALSYILTIIFTGFRVW